MRRFHLLLAAALVVFAGTAPAQAGPSERSIAALSADRQEDDDGNPRLGLLGLWGLAGLLGLLRRERNIHVDARREGRD